jgi:hypothetical protein
MKEHISDTRASVCRTCKAEYVTQYRRNIKAVIRRIHEGQVYNSKKLKVKVNYTALELSLWLRKNEKFMNQFRVWEEGRYKPGDRPWVIRKDLTKDFEFNNLTIVSQNEYYRINGRRHSTPIEQVDEEGNVVAVHPSIRGAAKIMGVNKGSIKGAIKNPHRKSVGYFWREAQKPKLILD